MSKHVRKDEQIKLIVECRQSGLSDYQWCEQNGIYPGNFYNWVSKLKKSGYTFPDSAAKGKAKANIQEVVKVDLVESVVSEIEQNTTLLETSSEAKLAAELRIGTITLRLFNGADEQVIQNTLCCLGGMNHAR